MPNGKFPLTAGKKLGFTKEQMEPGWIVPLMGNTYSGSSPTGFSATLDVAKPGDLILLVSFGSGAGSDAFIFKMTDRINKVRDKAEKLKSMLENNRIYLDYGQYAKYRGKIIMNE
jgi:hydroxymethylglutaryl-CoA synthase